MNNTNKKTIWIIFDSKYGSNIKLAQDIQQDLADRFHVKIGLARKTHPRNILADNPYGVVIGGPIHFGAPSLTIQSWMKKFGKWVQKSLIRPQKAVIYCTAFGDPEKGQILLEIAQNSTIASQINPSCLGLMVSELKGPLKTSEITKFIAHLQQFFCSTLQKNGEY